MELFEDDEQALGMSKEKKIIYGSIGAGIAVSLVGLLIYILGLIQIGGLILILGIMISVMPYSLISFLKNRALRDMESQFPAFLNDLSESTRGGMTMLKAMESASESEYGRLDKEIDKVYNQLTWGVPFPEVMKRFSERMKDSPVIQESLSIIIQSFESGGNITDTIDSVADNASRLRDVIRNKRSKLKQQLFIMYIIYFLFIGITIGIYVILSQLLGLGDPEAGALQEGVGSFLGDSSGPTNFCGEKIAAAQPFCSTAKVFGFVPSNASLGSAAAEKFSYGKMAYYKSLLFLMLMVQGISTAAVAGQIKEGSPSAGVKHAAIMLPIAFVAFMLIIRPMGL
jgi:flagellar protein FlaJ